MIKLGYLDFFYAIDIKNEKNYNDIKKILYNSKICATSKPNITQKDEKKIIEIDIRNEIYGYLENIENNVKELVNNKELISNEEMDFLAKFYQKVSNVGIFIERDISKMGIYRNTTTKLLSNNDINNDYESIILKPIIFIENDDIGYVSVSIDIYKIGVAIINFSIPIYNVPFKNLWKLEILFDNYSEITVPGEIYSENNQYIEKDYELFESINLYSDYIFNLINRADSNKPKVFEHYTIIDYTGIKDSFENFEDTFRKIFWIMNKPYTVLNEQSEETYNKSISNYYDMSKNCRMYVGSYGRVISIVGSGYGLVDKEEVYISIISQVRFSIHSVIINEVKLANTIKKMKKTGKNINRIKLEKFKLEKYLYDANKLGFSSVSNMTLYIEENIYDFFPKERYINELRIQDEIVTVKEGRKRDNINIFFVFISGMATVLFSYEPLCKVLALIDKRYSYNLSYYSFYIWMLIIVIIIIYILWIFLGDKLFE
ncbi:hypothetical protein [Clostridium perfringens]|uniref:hypothetical protein n=1 Tax=Clostridium perfringens TaxID=1502 RepID=UPI001ABBA1D8|nr:hypothetical protein [Clostridium perfringens]MBO3361342.1 hypothetical protein [Clostridium perfringens]HBI6884503.1 hypothetical protein [Clostridium perfringens]